MFASAQEASVELFSVKDGLAGNKSEYPVQDGIGIIWFLSSSKFHQYDGHHLLKYASPIDLSGAVENFLTLRLYQNSLLFLIAQKHIFF